MANRPRAYRETIAAALGVLHPDAQIRLLEPESLDAGVARFSPDLVICDEATQAVCEAAASWVELYPGYGSCSVVYLEGKREEVEELQFHDLLSIAARVEEKLRLG